MQREASFFNGRVSPTDVYGVGGNTRNAQFGGHYTYGHPLAPAFGSTPLAGTNYDFLVGPQAGLEFQPIDTCPRNFVIFDQTENKSRVLFHPTLAHKLNYPYNFDNCSDRAREGGDTHEKNNEHQDNIYSLKENTADIDALLGSDDDDDEEDDVVSTGRSPANWAGSSPNYSSSDEERMPSGASSSSGNGRKRDRVRKMVKVLREIIPGGDSMDTPAVLDEAVKYLKSVKVEVMKLGIHDFENP